MNRSPQKGLTARILAWALAIMPRERGQWADAMASELHSIPDAAGRTRFALGCLSVAVTERIRTRRTLAWIGRAMIAFSLFGVSLGGMALTQRFDSHQARDMIFVLCLFYSLAGALALTSLRGLRTLAGAGLVSFLLGWSWLALTSGAQTGFSVPFLRALTLEAGTAMAALLVASIYLSLVNSPGPEASDHA